MFLGGSEPVLVLASGSPRRREILSSLGVRFAVEVPEVEEVGAGFGRGAQIAMMNARMKAEAVAGLYTHRCILAADTVVCLADQIFGKPSSMEEATAMLEQLSGKAHEVMTGVSMIYRDAGAHWHEVVPTTVYFRQLDKETIQRYLDSIDPLDKAGGYAIQDGGEAIIERIEGSYSNVMGLPKRVVREWLKKVDLA
ncbi:MAG: Maf family protein [Puniceicoccaceae bacterium]